MSYCAKFVFQKCKHMNIKKHVPNFITLLNLLSGCIALIFAMELNFEMAFFFVSLGIFLDFFDGFFARLFKVSSPLGLQLDSLADMVTSGVVPGFIMVTMLSDGNNISATSWAPYLGFIITLASCYRLANFNIDTRQTDSFIGLPTPANALLILSLPLILQNNPPEIIHILLKNPYFLLAVTAFSAFILNAEIPLFSLKIKEFNFAKNKLQILFLTTSVVFLFVFQYLAIPMIILFYILLSVVNNYQLGKK